jgi:hypothetical protein
VWSFQNPRRRRRTAQVFLTSRKVSSCHEVHPTRDKILRWTGCTHAEDARAAQSRDFETGLCLPAPATTGPPVHARDGYQQLESGTSRRLVGSGEVDGAQGHAVLGNRLLSPGRTPDHPHSQLRRINQTESLKNQVPFPNIECKPGEKIIWLIRQPQSGRSRLSATRSYGRRPSFGAP